MSDKEEELDYHDRKKLDGVARLGISELTQFIVDNGMTISPIQLAELQRYAIVGGYPGKLFRHNGNTVQYLTSTYEPIPFPTIVREDLEYSYDSKTRGITIDRDGWYSIRANISVGITSNARQISEYAIFLNGKELAGSCAFGYHRLRSAGNTTTPLQYLLEVSKGDTVDIRAKELTRRDQKTIAGSCNVMIERA